MFLEQRAGGVSLWILEKSLWMTTRQANWNYIAWPCISHRMIHEYTYCIHLYISYAMYVIYLQCVRDVRVYSYTLSTFHNNDFIWSELFTLTKCWPTFWAVLEVFPSTWWLFLVVFNGPCLERSYQLPSRMCRYDVARQFLVGIHFW